MTILFSLSLVAVTTTTTTTTTMLADAFLYSSTTSAPVFGGGERQRQPRPSFVAASQLEAKSKRGVGGGGGFGGGGFGGTGASPTKKRSGNKKNKKSGNSGGGGGRLISAINDDGTKRVEKKNVPYRKDEQDEWLKSLELESSKTCLGRAVHKGKMEKEKKRLDGRENDDGEGDGDDRDDPFWDLMPSLIRSKFPHVRDEEKEFRRVAGFLRHSVHPDARYIAENERENAHPRRPLDEIHAYMPGLGKTKPFHDPEELELCELLSKNYDTIRQEYGALLQDMEREGGVDRFQSVTSMNYDSGWKTLVLFYNGRRIPRFPYHLCPVTTRLLEGVPLAGRIAGFNRQSPGTGIPLHTDGNNMWLTCQMGLIVPDDDAAYIRVADETRRWRAGECLLYDTTYEHETMNEHPDQERVVLHVDFFNTLSMTPIEIETMRYIYQLREEFMKAEGVSKVGERIL